MTKNLLYILLLLIGQSAAAREVVCNGLKYIIEEESTNCVLTGAETKSITDLIIPERIKAYGEEYTVIEIADSAFCGNSVIRQIIIGDSLKKIGKYAFYGNSLLKQVTIGESVKEIGIAAFYNCDSLKKVLFNALECDICTHVFSEKLKDVIIDDKVKSIAPYSFGGCMELTSLNIGREVTSIGIGSFMDCYNLKIINLPDSLINIGEHAFYNCPIEEVTIPKNVRKIGWSAFGSEKLNCIYFNATNCEQVGNYRGGSFHYVKRIVFGDNVERVPTKSFYGSKTLEEIHFGTMIKSIASEAFAACTALKHLTIDQNIAEIGQAAFKGCTSLQTLTIGKSVTTISGEAFKGCDSLKEITIEAEHLESCGTLWGSPFPEEVESVKMGKGVRNIPEYMFSGCRMLTGVDLSTAIEEIGNNAFQNCIRLEKIRMPEGVKTLGAKIFVGCSKLRAIESLSPEPAEADDNTFMSCDEVTLYVPEESVEKYRQARGWSRFKDIRPLDGSAIDEIEAEGHLEVKLTENGCVIPTGNYLTDIYDATGRRVYRGNGGEIRLERGLYIVVSGRGTREKIAIR